MIERDQPLIVYITERGREAYYWPLNCRMAVELMQQPFVVAHGMYVTFFMQNGRSTYRIAAYDTATQRYHLERVNAEVWMTE